MPADVDRYVKEMKGKDPSMSDDKAWAIAWSRYCKYKNPGSDSCKQDDYFTGRKTARDTEEYSKFSDAYLLDIKYGSGRTQVWYAKPGIAIGLDLARGYNLPDPLELEKTHVYIGNINESNPNKILDSMQGGMWSPNGQARSLPAIRACRHTSMTFGDVMIIGGETLIVARNGFYDLTTGMSRTSSARRVAQRAIGKAYGKLPPPKKFPAAQGLKDMTGGGAHHTRNKDILKGQSRKDKHKTDPRDKDASSLRLQPDYDFTEFWGE